jgi:hypothetical protein
MGFDPGFVRAPTLEDDLLFHAELPLGISGEGDAASVALARAAGARSKRGVGRQLYRPNGTETEHHQTGSRGIGGKLGGMQGDLAWSGPVPRSSAICGFVRRALGRAASGTRLIDSERALWAQAEPGEMRRQKTRGMHAERTRCPPSRTYSCGDHSGAQRQAGVE